MKGILFVLEVYIENNMLASHYFSPTMNYKWIGSQLFIYKMTHTTVVPLVDELKAKYIIIK